MASSNNFLDKAKDLALQAKEAAAKNADKIDGKAGMLTRAALGEYQKKNGLKLDCWPTQAVLDHMRGKSARNSPGTKRKTAA